MRVLITGSKGFIGKNFTSHLIHNADFQVLTCSRETSTKDLKLLVLEADIIFHFAGINRPVNPAEFETNDISLTKTITDVLILNNKKTPIIFTSSIQAECNNPYGLYKKKIEDFLFQFSIQNNSYVGVYRLPNIFGKWSKPNYNSVIATWCHNISRDIKIEISNPMNKMTLSYIDDVVESFLGMTSQIDKLKTKKSDFIKIDRIFNVTLGDVLEILLSFKTNNLLPPVDKELVKFLHSTYLSFLPRNKVISNLDGKIDERGAFFELLKSTGGGQFSFSTTKPGVTRGNHFHHTKNEKFIVIKGRALIKMRDTIDDTTYDFTVDGNNPSIVNMLPGYTHSITNIGTEDLLLIIWSNENYDPHRPDTYWKEV